MGSPTALLNLWARSWEKAGYETALLHEKDAKDHPGYKYFEERVSKFPTVNPPAYERACYMRHMAMANVPGATLLVDYDVIPNPRGKPYKFPLPSGIICLEPTRVPCAMFGTQSGFEDICDFLADYDASHQRHVSDMTILRKTALPIATPPLCVEHLCSGRNIENDPGQGWRDAPFIHFSTFSFSKLGWQGSKADLIERVLRSL